MRIVVVLLALALVPLVSAEDSAESPESSSTDSQSNGQIDNEGPDEGAQYPAPVWAGSDDDGTYVVVNPRLNSHDATWSGGQKVYLGGFDELCPLMGPICDLGNP